MPATLMSKTLREQRGGLKDKHEAAKEEHRKKTAAVNEFLTSATAEDKKHDSYVETRDRLAREMHEAGKAAAEAEHAIKEHDKDIALCEQAEAASGAQAFGGGLQTTEHGQQGPFHQDTPAFLWRNDNWGDDPIEKLKGRPLELPPTLRWSGSDKNDSGQIIPAEMLKEHYTKGFNDWARGKIETQQFANQVNHALAAAGSPDVFEQGGWLQPPISFINMLQRCNDKAVWIRQLATVRTVTNASSLGIRKRTKGITSFAWGCRCQVPADAFPEGQIKELHPRLYTLATKTCREVLRSSAVPVEPFLANEFAIAEREGQEQGYINGDGRNKPLGLFADPDLTIHNWSAAGTFGADVLIDMFGRLPERAMQMNNNSWIMSKELWLAIMKLPATGSGGYLWDVRAGSGIQNRPWRGTLLGVPVYVSEFVTGSLSANDRPAIIGDIGTYEIADFAFGTGLEREDKVAEDEAAWYLRRYTDGLAVCGDSIVRLEVTA